jgi:signal transduction histidine kinase
MWVKTWLAALQMLAAMGLIGLAVFLLAGVHWIGKPLRMINAKMRRVGQGDFNSDLQINSRDEFGQLAHEINRMCGKLQEQQQRIAHETEQRIEALEQLRHADRLVTVGQLAAGLAHEMGTPLNVVAGRASMILNEPEMGKEKLRENALAIKNEAMRISSIVQKGLDYSRQNEVKMVRTDLRDIVNNTVELLRPIARRQRIDIDVALPVQAAMAKCDPEHIQQVLMNLITNAIDAVDKDDAVQIRLEASLDKQDWILTISDPGHGIDPAIAHRVFEPFFTTKDVGFGTGLGLSIVKDIVEEHGGTIGFTSQPGQGTTFRIELPASEMGL